jgi:hypothetical protein
MNLRYGFEAPLEPEGYFIIGDAESEDPEGDDAHFKPVKVTNEHLQRGLTLLAEKHPRHWNDFLNENTDADTGDIFLQLCVLGEVTFG